MPDDARAPLTPEELALWRQTMRRREKGTGRRVVDAVLAEADAIGEMGNRSAAVTKIADRADVSERTVRYKLKQWEEQGLIHKERVGGAPGEGRQQGNAIEPALPEEIGDTEADMKDYGCTAPTRAGPQRNSRGLYRLRLTAVG